LSREFSLDRRYFGMPDLAGKAVIYLRLMTVSATRPGTPVMTGGFAECRSMAEGRAPWPSRDLCTPMAKRALRC
jgi:hypothetical protein